MPQGRPPHAADPSLVDPLPRGGSAVIVLSGGLDSATVLAIARHAGRVCHALTFDYGQRHRAELDAAGRVARALGAARHVVVPLDLRAFGGSALTADIPVPKDRSDDEMHAGVPATYVPARNLVFLSLAAGWAEVLGAPEVWIGVNAVDYSGYPDCRPEFLESFQRTVNLATRAGVDAAAGGRSAIRVVAPIVSMTKAQIIRRGAELGVDFALTHSCYDPDPSGAACGRCDSCLIRSRGFQEAGVVDPTRYQTAAGVVR
ncbi:MAG: 7-cyano-7-deazaguanine synthase QueC [Phycisphaerales bacterium]|nr:7-cyano-7-deazaguanine synthase QueC [Phycisphaerales bacterium]